ncbi:C-type lectin 37Db-like [Drosophila kikkawai]|uniref:C-type lectin 37Db-like n=1 Tax=Drosophila kikkawai TaxID=30033 RepID=A0ABM4GAA7_DROKI
MMKLEAVILRALSALHLQGGVVAGEPQALEIAFNLCRQMGGQLATIESEAELTAIVGKLPRTLYWLGVTNLANRNVYTSVASGKKHWNAFHL